MALAFANQYGMLPFGKLTTHRAFQMSHWGDYQSLAQLAVATNSAFGAIAGFIGDDITKERSRLERVRGELSRRSAEETDFPAVDALGRPFDLSIRASIAYCVMIERKVHFYISNFIRAACVVGSILSFILLVLSCFRYGDDIGTGSIIGLVACNMPFFAGLAVITHFAMKIKKHVGSNRRELEQIAFGT